MDTMKQLTVLAVLSLCCTSLTSGTGHCHPEGPENCTIVPGEYSRRNHTVCSWSLGSSFTFYTSNTWSAYFNWFVGLTRNRQEGKLTSRTACSTGGEWFWYKFEQNNTIDLSVSIQYEGTGQAESLLWIMSSSDDWGYAGVPINTDQNFTFVFKAKRRFPFYSSLASVFIDGISYRTYFCTSRPYPSNAQPTTTTILSTTTSITPTESSKLTTSITPTTTTTTTAADTTSPESSPPSTTVKHAGTAEIVTIPTTLESVGKTTSKESNNIGIIVGVIVAVLVVIVIVIAVLLVAFRRKNILFWKACCRDKQPKEHFHMNASNNVAYSLNADDSDHVNKAVTNHTQQNSENHRLEARASTYSSTNHNYENTPTNHPSETVYAAVNKPQKVSQETPPQSQSKPHSTVYEMFNEEAANCYDAEGTEYQNLPPTIGKQELDGQESSSSSVYHILEKESGTDSNSVQHVQNASVTATAQDHDEEYNKLDFDTKGRGETNSFDEEKTERATDGVYSHLNEGDGDTYNEVHREKRDEVIDGVYSHIT